MKRRPKTVVGGGLLEPVVNAGESFFSTCERDEGGRCLPEDPTWNESLTANPFVSEEQRRACYAKDDPGWDCKEWESHTPDVKLPKRVTRNARRAPNPLRVDPTRTIQLRKAFISKVRRQFALLRGELWKLIVVEDAFGLKDRAHNVASLSRNALLTADLKTVDVDSLIGQAVGEAMAAMERRLGVNYSEDQPRDDHGRFASESGEATALRSKVFKGGGFTYKPIGSKSAKSGVVVSLPRSEGWERPVSADEFKSHGRKIAREYLHKVRDAIREGKLDAKHAHVGAWHDKSTNRVVLDVNEVYESKEEAIRVGRQRKQDAVFDLGTFTEIDLRPTGKRTFSQNADSSDRRGDRRGIGAAGGRVVPGSGRVDNFDPDQPRDADGKFSSVGGGTAAAADHGGRVLDFAKSLPGKFVAGVKAKVAAKYSKLEARYGKGYAKAIIGAALIGLPIPAPGASFASAAVVIGLAELHRLARGGPKVATANEEFYDHPAMTEDEVQAEAARLVEDLTAEFADEQGSVDGPRTLGHDRVVWDGTRNYDEDQPRDEHGRWTSGGGGRTVPASKKHLDEAKTRLEQWMSNGMTEDQIIHEGYSWREWAERGQGSWYTAVWQTIKGLADKKGFEYQDLTDDLVWNNPKIDMDLLSVSSSARDKEDTHYRNHNDKARYLKYLESEGELVSHLAQRDLWGRVVMTNSDAENLGGLRPIGKFSPFPGLQSLREAKSFSEARETEIVVYRGEPENYRLSEGALQSFTTAPAIAKAFAEGYLEGVNRPGTGTVKEARIKLKDIQGFINIDGEYEVVLKTSSISKNQQTFETDLWLEFLHKFKSKKPTSPDTSPPTTNLSAADVDRAAADADTNPTDAQREAGNYRKGFVTVQGLRIAIETPKGVKRRPWHDKPLAWHYGYIKRHRSEADGDHVDVFLGPDPESETVFVVDQYRQTVDNPKSGMSFDEHKCLIGWHDEESAKAAYLANYSDDWRGFGGIRELSMAEFKRWLREGDTSRPICGQKLTTNAGRWAFESDPDKLKAFQAWLRKKFTEYLRGKTQQQLWEEFAKEGFKKGAGRAFDDANRAQRAQTDSDADAWQRKMDFYAGTKEQFLKSSFGRPETKEKIQLLASRSFEELENVTEDMSNKISRQLVSGLVQGKNPRDIAKDIDDVVGIGLTRAETIAQTEIIRTHAEGQLDAMEAMGVEEVGVMVEWQTANDDRVCPQCNAMEGVVLKLEEAHNLIPLHPRCRCAWLPANVGEDQEDQVRGKRAIDRAIREANDEGAEIDLDVGADRPRSVVKNQLAGNESFFEVCERDEHGWCTTFSSHDDTPDEPHRMTDGKTVEVGDEVRLDPEHGQQVYTRDDKFLPPGSKFRVTEIHRGRNFVRDRHNPLKGQRITHVVGKTDEGRVVETYLHEISANYDADQARDESGRWTSGGGETFAKEEGKGLTQEINDRFPEGPRRQHARSAAISDSPKYFDVHTLRDDDGKLVGVVSVWNSPDYASPGIPSGRYLRIGNIATSSPGYGKRLVQEVVKLAASKDAGIELTDTESSSGFYPKVGFKEGGNAGTWYMSADDVKKMTTNESFFATCDRDEKGHCLPGAGSGGGRRTWPAPAPKGGPNPKVIALAKTPEFKAWFGKSKVVDEDGNPAEQYPPTVVYHGTPKGQIETFDKAFIANPDAQHYGPGFYFTEDPEAAQVFAKGGHSETSKGSNPTVMSFLLKAENPFDVDYDVIDPAKLSAEHAKVVRATMVQKAFSEYGRDEAKEEGAAFDRGDRKMPYRELTDAAGRGGYGVSKTAVAEYLKTLGHDSLTTLAPDAGDKGRNRYWIVFEPTQIKSTDNKGTFDPSNPNTRNAEGDPEVTAGFNVVKLRQVKESTPSTQNGGDPITENAGWDEDLHPRDESGKFASGPGGSGGSSNVVGPGGDTIEVKGERWLPFVDPDDVNQWDLNRAAQQAVDRCEALMDDVVGERVREYRTWGDVPGDVQDESEDSYINATWSAIADEETDNARDNDVEMFKQDLKDDEELAKGVWDQFIDDHELPPVFKDRERFEAEQTKTGFNVFTVSDDDEDQEELDSVLVKFKPELDRRLDDEVDRRVDAFIQDWQVPDDIRDNAIDIARERWQNKTDDEKLEWAGLDGTIKIEEPDEWKVTKNGEDYKRSRLCVLEMQARMTESEAEARGLRLVDGFDPHDLAGRVWGEWKGSSTSPTGLLLQHAAALEFGGKSQRWTQDQNLKIEEAARLLVKNSLVGDEGLPGRTPTEKLTNAGVQLMRAHVRATWAASQYAMERAGVEHMELYRGLMLSGSAVNGERTEEHPVEHKSYNYNGEVASTYTETMLKLPDVQLKRNGAASTAADDAGRSTANNWQGVGDAPSDAERVVLRIKAPRESVLSLPVFGQNVHEEHEVVLLGTKYRWDAWKGKAPSFKDVPMKE